MLKDTLETQMKTWAHGADDSNYMVRPRLNALLEASLKNPLVIICAGAGYGKTRAVSDFLREQKKLFIWMQFSERDNVGTRFWEILNNAVGQINRPLADKFLKLGFPDTPDKLDQFFFMLHRGKINQRGVYVMDDCHFLEVPLLIQFIDRLIHDLPDNRTLIMICRELPKINIVDMKAKGLISIINEDDLHFTESELTQYINQLDLSVERDCIREIYQDTSGWAFAINLIVQALQKSPGYSGYARNATKKNIFNLLEKEVWGVVSEELRCLLARISLVDHLSADLVGILSAWDERLLNEFRQQNAYIRFDSYIDAYRIHHLFLEFLRTKYDILTEQEKCETYQSAADWCNSHGFKIDAMDYYEKSGDYDSIVSILFEYPMQLPRDIALFTIKIFERASADTYDRVNFLAVMHIRAAESLGRWQQFFELIEHYEQKYLKLPEDDTLRNHTLVGIYFFAGTAKALMSTFDDIYDFIPYFKKMGDCFAKYPAGLDIFIQVQCGAWAITTSSSLAGAPQGFIEAINQGDKVTPSFYNGTTLGINALAQGELLFYQGNLTAAEPYFLRSIESARKREQCDIMHRALFYLLRIAVSQGNQVNAGQTLRSLESLLDNKDYQLRYTTYDIALGWYYCALRQPKIVPEWLKNKFTPYIHACFIENFGNQIKARYCFMARDFQPLLLYINEMKQRESILFGRVEMLAIEACVHYQMKEKKRAFMALREAYKQASPNDIVMPFIELGKDMRTLIDAALRASACDIPRPWLEGVKRKASSYAKRQAFLISSYNEANSAGEIPLSSRENEILCALYNGMSRSEIARNLNISMNRVNTVINNIYYKLGANSIVDAVRIAAERKLF